MWCIAVFSGNTVHTSYYLKMFIELFPELYLSSAGPERIGYDVFHRSQQWVPSITDENLI